MSELELTPAQWDLVLEHLAFATRAAAKAARRWPTADPVSLEEWAMHGLMLAAASYDPTRGARFTTWAMHRVRGAIVDGHRSQYGRRNQRVEAQMPEGYDHEVLELEAPPLMAPAPPSWDGIPWLVLVWLYWDRALPCRHCGARLVGHRTVFCTELCKKRSEAGSDKQGPKRAWVRRSVPA